MVKKKYVMDKKNLKEFIRYISRISIEEALANFFEIILSKNTEKEVKKLNNKITKEVMKKIKITHKKVERRG